jgi:3-phenylpropionate/trans-cinnamate dioxygenase ferredoxin reductase component
VPLLTGQGPVLVVGAGVAAHGAVTGLRSAGFGGEVVVIGREPLPPYQRPPLSKAFLTGQISREELLLPPLQARLMLGQEVVELDVEGHVVTLASGEIMQYSRLLIATGGRPRRHPDHGGLYLRDIRQAERLRHLLRSGDRLEVLGAGFIGCEVAAAASALDVPVSLYEVLEQPLLRVLGPEVGAWLASVHRSRGVDLHTGVSNPPRPGPRTLVAIGSEPSVELAQAAGLRCEGGVLVDALGRTTSPDVYAAGDCARFWSPSLDAAVRVEHFQTALRHGESVGRSMAGRGLPFEAVPWFWSDQYAMNIQYAGAALPWDETVVRGRFGEPPFSLFYLKRGRLRAALGVDDGRTISRARRFLESRVELPAEALRRALADPGVDLKALARPG